MKICYIDESGCSGILPAANSPNQPALVICGLFLDVARLKSITYDFLKWTGGLVVSDPLGKQHSGMLFK